MANLNRFPEPTTVLKDYWIQGIVVKDVPFILDNHNKQDPYLLDGRTLERVYSLINENELNENRKQLIYY